MPPSRRPEAAQGSAPATRASHPPLEVLARGGTVVTATRRLARHLQLTHDRSRQQAGEAAWPAARVLPWEAWLARTWESAALGSAVPGAAPAGTRAESRVESRAEAEVFRSLLSDDELRLLWRGVIGQSGTVPSLDVPVFADLAMAAWALCRNWGIPPGDLQRAADSADTSAFAGWAVELDRQCRVAGRIDSATAAVLLAYGDGPAPALRSEHCFAGFDPWTPTAGALADRIVRCGGRVSQAAEGGRPGQAVRVAAADPAGEIRLAAEWARRELDRDPSVRIGLVVQDLERDGESIRRLCKDVLAPGWQLREPAMRVVSLSGGRRLGTYPAVHAALLFLRATTGTLEWLEASALLRSPFFGDTASRNATAQVELMLRRRPLASLPVATLAGMCREPAAGIAQALDECRRQGEPPGRRRAPAHWADVFSRLLEAAGWPGGRPLDSEAFQVREAWQRLLESFAICGSVVGAVTVAEAVELLADLAHRRPFEPEGREDGLQVLGPLEAEGLAFDRLWVSGLVAEALPAPARPNPLVPLDLQRRQGVPQASAALSLGLAERRFGRLLRSAGAIVCSWPVRMGDEETVMSPLLADLPDGDEPALRARPAASDRVSVRESVILDRAVPDAPPPLLAGGSAGRGARLLSRQALCPALAFCEGRLGARELEAPAGPLSPRMRGEIAHRLFERLYRQDDCRRGLAKPPEGTLREAFDAVIGPVLEEFLPAGDPYLERLRTLEDGRLWRLCLAMRAVDAGLGEFSVRTEYPTQVRAGPLDLRIRLDRVDERGNGALVVFDYKTGEFKPKGWTTPRLMECQLPLYATVPGVKGIGVLQLGLPATRTIGVADARLGVDTLKTPERFLKDSDADWPALVARWRDQLRLLAEEFVAGDFRVNPNPPPSGHGQFALLTRIHELGLWSDDDGSGAEAAGTSGGDVS